MISGLEYDYQTVLLLMFVSQQIVFIKAVQFKAHHLPLIPHF